jgi:dihydrofolate reductase
MYRSWAGLPVSRGPQSTKRGLSARTGGGDGSGTTPPARGPAVAAPVTRASRPPPSADAAVAESSRRRVIGSKLAMSSPARHGPTAMRLLIIDFISLDGVVQAPGGKGEDDDGGFQHGGWSGQFFDPEVMGAVIGETMEESEALLFGRRTWDGMAAAWPARAGDPYADAMNAIRKYVVSTTLDADEAASRWNNTQLIGGDDPFAAIRELKESGGDGVIQAWGSATLARQLVEHDLVDEYRLLLEPILLGGGKSIFPADGQARPLELVSVRQAKTGVLVCSYRPARTGS